MVDGPARDSDGLAVQLLDAVAKHRAVNFIKDVFSDLDAVVGGDSDDMVVERRVVDFAQGQAVGHDGFTVLLAVLDDVSGVQEFAVPQVAHGAGFAIRIKYILSEAGLMQPLVVGSECIASFGSRVFAHVGDSLNEPV